MLIAKNPRHRQPLAPLQGGASKSSLQFCSKPGDGFPPWNFRDRTGFQFSFPSIRFSLPSFFDFGVGIKAGDQHLKQVRSLYRS